MITKTLPFEKKDKRVRVKFTADDDAKLKALYQIFGNNWNAIATQMRSKNARQCKDRWTLYLTPTRNDEPFTNQEINQLTDLVEKYGHKWKIISKFLNRTDVQIKNLWKVLQRKKNLIKTTTVENPPEPQPQPVFTPPVKPPEPVANPSFSTGPHFINSLLNPKPITPPTPLDSKLTICYPQANSFPSYLHLKNFFSSLIPQNAE